MANKRQQKKNMKKQMQRQIASVDPNVRVKGKTEKELKEIITHQEQQKQQEQKRVNKRKTDRNNLIKRRAVKSEAVAKLGVDPFSITLKQLDSIKLKDIQDGNINRSTYPFLFKGHDFDYGKVYKLKDNQRLYLAYRDFAGETSLEEILNQYKAMTNEQLMDRLEQIASIPPSYSKSSKTGSSGSAGDYRMTWAKQNVISDFQDETYNVNRRKATKKHPGSYKGFQVIKNGRLNSFDEVTPRGLLIFMNAFMHNITEGDRVTFYNDMYQRIEYHIPEFAKILPKPL